jgi:hypothetical protein
LIFLAACHGSGADPAPDGGPDPNAPPHIVATAPTSWLHEATRVVFDQPLDPGSLGNLGATVMLAGLPLASELALDGDRAVAIVVDPAARGVGELAIDFGGVVSNLAGRAAPVAAQMSATLAPWSLIPVDRGIAVASPSLAITRLGSVVAAWCVGDAGTRQVVVALLERGVWQPLGDPMPSDDACSIATVVDGDGSVLVGWIRQSAAHVARWTTGAWTELASPGAGRAIALAVPEGGPPIVAAFGATATVQALSDQGWVPIGPAVPLANFVGEPQLAVASATRLAIGWLDATGTISVMRWEGSVWTALAPIVVGVPPAGIDRPALPFGSAAVGAQVPAVDRLSLAARGMTIAVAWDQWAGSFAVLAAFAPGNATTWTQLGHALDVDVAGDAVAPVIALDAAERPIIAWTELIETAWRGVIAQWSGSGWTIVGGPTWLPEDGAPPERPTLALAPGDAPVVGFTVGGRVGVARFDGPAVAGDGLMVRASLAGCAFSAAAPPTRLSQTGCFTIPTPGQAVPHPGLIPYDVVVELWSDGARKRRWIALPDGTSMSASATGAWAAPPGAFVFKEFALETTPGDPATRRAIETRVLVADPARGWQGFSYRWNATGTDATLEPDDEDIVAWPMDDGSTHRHVYPSRSECLSCHQGSYGPLLGLRAPQLARWFDYGGVIADQAETLAHLGVGPASNAAPFASPHDPSETWEHRMRGYMAANCAHCHNPGDIAVHDLRYTTPLAQTNLCPDIVPGDPAASRTYQLVSSRPGMPPLATLATDPLAVEILGNWISGMTSCP